MDALSLKDHERVDSAGVHLANAPRSLLILPRIGSDRACYDLDQRLELGSGRPMFVADGDQV